ncbi:hypothetical protein NG2371_02878 [Nocardia gamkensis]|nr:hypothetical protein [Nocardia gamkensis]
MVRAVAFADLCNATEHIRRLTGWGRRNIRPPQRVTQHCLLVRPFDLYIAVTRLNTSTRMVGDESAQTVRRTLTPQELGAIHRVESSPTNRWSVADVMQPRRSLQEVRIVNHIDGLPSMPSDALDVPPPSRHADKIVPRQLRSPGNEVIGHTGNRKALSNGPLLPRDCTGQTRLTVWRPANGLCDQTPTTVLTRKILARTTHPLSPGRRQAQTRLSSSVYGSRSVTFSSTSA